MTSPPDANVIKALDSLLAATTTLETANARLDAARERADRAEIEEADARKHLLTVNGPSGYTRYVERNGHTYAITIPPHDTATEYDRRLLGITVERLPVVKLATP